MFRNALVLLAAMQALVSAAPYLNVTIPSTTDILLASGSASSVFDSQSSSVSVLEAVITSSPTVAAISAVIGAVSSESTPLASSQDSSIANSSVSSHSSVNLGHVITGKSSFSPTASTAAVLPSSSLGAVLPPSSHGAILPPSSLGTAAPLSSTGAALPYTSSEAARPPSFPGAVISSDSTGAGLASSYLGAAVPPLSAGVASVLPSAGSALPTTTYGTVSPPVKTSSTFSNQSRTCPHPKPRPSNETIDYYTIDDVDTCEFPPLDKYPVVAWPMTSRSLPEQEPSIALWHALSMDQWLGDLFSPTRCPAALDTRTTASDGKDHEAFSKVLGRLMFGQKDGAFSAITCNRNRCNWNAESGWCRGDMFASESQPCWGLDTCPPGQTNTDLYFIEKLRRWYALQALGNVWDHKKSAAEAMVAATPAISLRMEKFMDDWAPTFVAGVLVPPVSPFSAIFNIFKAVASFIPVAGPAISTVLATADAVFPITDPTKIKEPSKPNKEALEDMETLMAVKDAVAKQAKGISIAVNTVLEVSGGIKEVLSDGTWIPEHFDPVFPIGAANMKDKFADVFTNMASAMGQVFDDSINGPPNGPNGFLTLVKGGLYSTSSMNPDNMRKDSLEELIPTYLAFTEDKLLQAIMRSYGIFFMTGTYSSQAVCENARNQDHGDWAGSMCFPSLDGQTWRSLTPYTSNFGSDEVYKQDGTWERFSHKQNLHQTWPHMTSQKIQDNLRGAKSGTKFPATILDIYQKLSACFDATNAGVVHRPDVGGSSTGFQNFPDAIPTTSTSPLDAICHWNLPVIDPHPVVDQDYKDPCMDDYTEGGAAWTFRTDHLGSGWSGEDRGVNNQDGKSKRPVNKSGRCLMSEQGWVERVKCINGVTIYACSGGGNYAYKYYKYSPRPGPGLYYARALAYPKHSDCVLDSAHISCDPF